MSDPPSNQKAANTARPDGDREWLTFASLMRASGGLAEVGGAVSRFLLVSALVVIALLAVTREASGQNLLTNAGFDTSLSAWANDNSSFGTVSWSSLDRSSSPTSGSAYVADNAPNSLLGLMFGQCVSVSPSTTYDSGVYSYIPAGQATTGFTTLDARLYDGVGCSGAPTTDETGGSVVTTGSWQLGRITFTTGSTTSSVRFYVITVRESPASGLFTVYLDDAFLRDVDAGPESIPTVSSAGLIALGAILASIGVVTLRGMAA